MRTAHRRGERKWNGQSGFDGARSELENEMDRRENCRNLIRDKCAVGILVVRWFICMHHSPGDGWLWVRHCDSSLWKKPRTFYFQNLFLIYLIVKQKTDLNICPPISTFCCKYITLIDPHSQSSMLMSMLWSTTSELCDWFESSSNVIFMHVNPMPIGRFENGSVTVVWSSISILSSIKSSRQDFKRVDVTILSRRRANERWKYSTALSSSPFKACTKPMAVNVGAFCGFNTSACLW